MNKGFPLAAYLGLWVFGIAFGLNEAAVVVYLRELFGIDGASLFPLATTLGEMQTERMEVEIYRELATLLLMLVPALLFSDEGFPRFLAYVLIFGVWDVAYYVLLYLFIGWPDSLFTYDVLFLLPTVWVAPVFFPLLIAVTMIAFSTVYLFLGRIRLNRAPSLVHWAVAAVGGVLVLYSFMERAGYYLAGGTPQGFAWWWFFAGYALAVVAGAHFLTQFARQSKMRFL